MPYNNTPVPPPKEYTGTVSLPLARVKKIIHADEDIANCSNNAAFVITIATEMFIQHLVERSHEIVKSEKRNRKNMQYTDVANAVARLDNLEFLTDVVPRKTTYNKVTTERGKNYKPGPAKIDIGPSRNGFFHSNGTEASSSRPQPQIINDVDEDDMVVDERYAPAVVHDPIQEQLAMEMAEGERANGN